MRSKRKPASVTVITSFALFKCSTGEFIYIVLLYRSCIKNLLHMELLLTVRVMSCHAGGLLLMKTWS